MADSPQHDGPGPTMARILALLVLVLSPIATLLAQTVEIHQIQGSGASSPYTGTQVVSGTTYPFNGTFTY